MAKIKNKTGYFYDLSRTYIADMGDNNAERMMLREAKVKKYTISSDGKISVVFDVAGEDSPVNPSDMTLYCNLDSYKAGSKSLGDEYGTVEKLLNKLGVPDDLYEVTRDRQTTTQYIEPKGCFINADTMIEDIDFPDSWEFERTEDGTWVNNANYFGFSTYATRQEALINHQIKLLKFDNTEVTI